MLKSTIYRKIIISGILIHTILLTYFLLFAQYFQQDEWHGFGIILSQGVRYITLDKSILELLLGDRVGARLITFGLFNSFNLNPIPYGAFALMMQILNTYLVFLLTKRLTKQSSTSLLASFLFLINEVGHEVYSWFGTMSGSLPSVFFFLLSLIFFLRFTDTKKAIFVLLSAFLLWVSFLFKEVGAFAFIFYPILFLIRSQKRNLNFLLKSHFSFIILGTIMIIFFVKTVLFIPGDRANYVNTGGSLIPNLITHAIQYPLEGIIQTIIPNQYLFMFSDIVTRIINPDLQPDSLDFLVATQTYNAEVAIILLLLVAIIIATLLIKKTLKNISNHSLKTMQISILMTILSFLPYIVINRSFSYLDSRYYYVGAIGIAIFLATLIFNLLNANKKILKAVGLLILAFYIFIHESSLFSDFKLMADRSQERQSFLRQIDKLVPVLQKKTVFFINGDSEGYYGLPELKVPFQSGPGHVILVKYVIRRKLSAKFFDEKTKKDLYDVGFLYDILGQGYREVNGQGFGYYHDQEEIKKALTQKLFSRKDVISLYYNEESRKIERKAFN